MGMPNDGRIPDDAASPAVGPPSFASPGSVNQNSHSDTSLLSKSLHCIIDVITAQLSSTQQDFQKPFDAPAVVVVGHQSSGKSALIEALMGFQFNQVGGGTKTRRPVALRMQYNPKCASPQCFLQGDDGVERPKSLGEIQAYIESENLRLERDPVRCFDSREINIRMEYKYCPNLILIDTPGLIAAPKTPKGSSANVQSRALQASAREVRVTLSSALFVFHF